MWAEVILVIGAYLFGSLPTLQAIGRIRGINLSQEGDLHSGVWLKIGRVEGAIGILIDLVKGALPVILGLSLGFSLLAVTISGLMAVVGQMWPIFQKFDGEKGNSTGLAMVAALAHQPLLIALIPIAIGAGIRTVPRLLDSTQSLGERFRFGGPPSRSLPLGMLIGFGVLPLSAWWLQMPEVITLAYLALFLLIVIRRLMAGLGKELKTATGLKGILIYRFLYDRGE